LVFSIGVTKIVWKHWRWK